MASGVWERTTRIPKEERTPVPPQQGFFYVHHPTDRIAHTTELREREKERVMGEGVMGEGVTGEGVTGEGVTGGRE